MKVNCHFLFYANHPVTINPPVVSFPATRSKRWWKSVCLACSRQGVQHHSSPPQSQPVAPDSHHFSEPLQGRDQGEAVLVSRYPHFSESLQGRDQAPDVLVFGAAHLSELLDVQDPVMERPIPGSAHIVDHLEVRNLTPEHFLLGSSQQLELLEIPDLMPGVQESRQLRTPDKEHLCKDLITLTNNMTCCTIRRAVVRRRVPCPAAHATSRVRSQIGSSTIRVCFKSLWYLPKSKCNKWHMTMYWLPFKDQIEVQVLFKGYLINNSFLLVLTKST